MRPKDCLVFKLRKLDGKWSSPAKRRQSLLNEETFVFLNFVGRLSELGWDDPQVDKLWRYNLHYFDDLNAEDSHDRTAWHTKLLKRWVTDNAPYVGSGWEPYPTSLRIVNWVKWYCLGNTFPREVIQSLAAQASWLSCRIEWHLLGNHLFANAKALVFAGVIFKGNESQIWLSRGLKIIANELPEQILADGGNFERSPMYHAIFLEDLMDLINLAQAYPDCFHSSHIVAWQKTAMNMMRFLEGMCHPDGEISFFNDSAIGIAPSPKELLTYAERIGIAYKSLPVKPNILQYWHFSNTGYVRVQVGFAVAFLDVALIGPDYLPGHAHADTLSFELSLLGQRVIVNGGTSEYGNSPIRLQERATAAHSTVEIDGKNSSEVWSGFRVARRAYPSDLQIDEVDEAITVSCAHDGYRRLSGRPMHHRSWRFTKNKLLIEDRVTGQFDTAVSRFHLHPNLEIVEQDSNYLLMKFHGGMCNIKVLSGHGILESSFYSPEFGKRLKTQCLAVHFKTSRNVAVEICWDAND